MTKNIVKKTIEVEEVTYVANDGEIFNDEFECRCHENEMANEIEEVKFERLFHPINDEITITVSNGIWYKVSLVTEEDVVDFFTISKNRFSDHYYDGDRTSKHFVEEYMNTVRSGKIVELLLYADCEGYYLSRFDITCEKERTFEMYLNSIDNIFKLAEEMKKHIRLDPSEATEVDGRDYNPNN